MKGTPMYDLKGKTAVVTGGASGIGRSICLRLAAEGADVAVFDVNADSAAETAGLAAEHGVEARAFGVDVSSPDSVDAAFAEVRNWRGGVDILVNSAGIIAISTVEETTSEDWRRVFAVNVDGVFHTCRAVVPGMRAQGSGKIINLSSWFGKQGKPNYGAYSASKAAVIGLTQSLAMELASAGVNVNAVCPGTIFETGMRDFADKLSAEKNLSTATERAKAIPVGRVGRPDDIARVVAFLASEEADYMTGQSINVTGGLIMH
jgi:NAD(P)-dependent dehydrogenase (short-subunit alcohol dehydrogenase family)